MPNGNRTRKRARDPESRIIRKISDDIPVIQLAYSWLEMLDSPRALTVHLLHLYGEHEQLVRLTFDPHLYDTAEKARAAVLATELFSKWDHLETGIDTKAVALEKGHEAELRNQATNTRLRTAIAGPAMLVGSVPFHSLLERARVYIVQAIGTRPPRSITSFRKFGPGRTTVSYGNSVSLAHKFGVKPDVTASAFALSLAMLNELPRWAASVLDAQGPCSILPRIGAVEISEGNVAITVPKNAKTDRLISYEPHLNICLQLSAGSFIRDRLKRQGIDLDDQTTNQRLATLGSLDGSLCTIDLSMASDTLSIETVKSLLPEEWFHYLDRIRSRFTRWPDGWKRNSKFASMGNGFTFELETLVFWALAKASSPDMIEGVNFSVYGDDIVVPNASFEELSRVLDFFGFAVNQSKSYHTSFFRESCGAFCFSGRSLIVPRLRPDRNGQNQFRVLWNQIIRSCSGWYGVVPRRTYRKLLKIRKNSGFPVTLGPDGKGDGHFLSPFDEARPHSDRNGWEGYWYLTKVPVTRPGHTLFESYTRKFYYASILASLLMREGKFENVFDSVYTDRTTWADRKSVV